MSLYSLVRTISLPRKRPFPPWLCRRPAGWWRVWLIGVFIFALWEPASLPLHGGERPLIRVGLDPAWPPFSMIDADGNWAGMDVDLLQIIADQGRVDIEIHPPVPWPEIYEKALRGEVDVLASTAYSPERERDFLFTRVYIDFPVAIITRRDRPFLISFEQLAGHRVAAPVSHVVTDFIRNRFPKIQLVETASTAEALESVSRGETDATAANLAHASHIIRERGLTNLKISGLSQHDFPLRLAVRRDRPDLQDLLDDALVRVPPDVKAAILARWVHVEYDSLVIWERVRPYLLSAILFTAAAMALVLLWNRRLAAEIGRRRLVEADLAGTRDNLRRINEEKSQILAMAAHDLRTPLTNILFQMEVLRMRPRIDKAELDAANERITEQSKRIHHMVNQLLTADALETGAQPFHLVEEDLREPVSKAILEHADHALKKDIRLEFFPPKEPMRARVDAYAFAQVLDNLISNGLKFTPKGGRVRVDLITSDEWAELRVRDSGPGFSKEDREHIFTKFRKLSARPTDGEGSTGLGLCITRSLVEAMHGQILMERPPEGGALMRVRFPAANSRKRNRTT
ncbi:MAG: transporter substrate-binding domain-containing protein [Opitutales bacterium]|nr:transporter substrate-binding domain-containing protein [Opitutales bacterium]